MHWSEKYVGEPYVSGVADCAALAARVAREVLGIACRLPDVHEKGLRGQAAQIQAHKDTIAERSAVAMDGHPVLFIGRGRTCHIGVMCWIASEWWVLHADQSAGFVIRQRLRDMTRVLYQLEGFYTWK